MIANWHIYSVTAQVVESLMLHYIVTSYASGVIVLIPNKRRWQARPCQPQDSVAYIQEPSTNKLDITSHDVELCAYRPDIMIHHLTSHVAQKLRSFPSGPSKSFIVVTFVPSIDDIVQAPEGRELDTVT